MSSQVYEMGYTHKAKNKRLDCWNYHCNVQELLNVHIHYQSQAGLEQRPTFFSCTGWMKLLYRFSLVYLVGSSLKSKGLEAPAFPYLSSQPLLLYSVLLCLRLKSAAEPFQTFNQWQGNREATLCIPACRMWFRVPAAHSKKKKETHFSVILQRFTTLYQTGRVHTRTQSHQLCFITR